MAQPTGKKMHIPLALVPLVESLISQWREQVKLSQEETSKQFVKAAETTLLKKSA